MNTNQFANQPSAPPDGAENQYQNMQNGYFQGGEYQGAPEDPRMRMGTNQPFYGQQYPGSYQQYQPQNGAPGVEGLESFQSFRRRKFQTLHQAKIQAQNSNLSAGRNQEPNTNILDKQKIKQMCEDMCGNRDVLDDKVCNILAIMVDQMVENVVDHSCMYARHRNSDTLEKEDVAFAVGQLFPEVARDHKVRDVQLLIDQQVNINHATNSMPPTGATQAGSVGAAMIQGAGPGGAGAPLAGGTSIGVGGQISTANYKSKLLRVRKEQEQQMTMSNVKESLKQQAQNPNSGFQTGQLGAHTNKAPSRPDGQPFTQSQNQPFNQSNEYYQPQNQFNQMPLH